MTGTERLEVLSKFFKKNKKQLMEYELFDLKGWINIKVKEPDDAPNYCGELFISPTCGYTGCAVGWATTIPKLKEEGLVMYDDCVYYTYKDGFTTKKTVSFAAVEKFFEIHTDVALFLFLKEWYSNPNDLPCVIKRMDLVIDAKKHKVMRKPGICVENIFKDSEKVLLCRELYKLLLRLDGWISLDYFSTFNKVEKFLWSKLDNKLSKEKLKDVEELTHVFVDQLNAEAPMYCYFGNDARGYGFFVSETLINNAVEDGELIKLSDVPNFENTDNEVWNGAQFALVINDHGNMTLYNRFGTEIWSVV